MLNDTIGATPRSFQSLKGFPAREKVFDKVVRKPVAAATKSRIMRVARAFRFARRLSKADVIVLETLLFSIMGADGACFPSFDTIARKAGVSRSTAQVAVSALEAVGLLRIYTRLIRRELDVGRGPQLVPRRATNCYVFLLPDVELSAVMLAPRPRAIRARLSGRAVYERQSRRATMVALMSLLLACGASAPGFEAADGVSAPVAASRPLGPVHVSPSLAASALFSSLRGPWA